MAILPDDMFARHTVRRRRPHAASALAFALVFASLALLVLSRLHHPLVERLRRDATPVLAPALTAMAGPIEPIRSFQRRLLDIGVTADELAQLRAENERLKGWEWRAKDLQRQLDELSRQANLMPAPEIPFITARVVADATGPFVRSIVIDAGADRGVKVGHPVINEKGLVGRIVDVVPSAARVLLLTDINSRIPVVVGDTHVDAISMGDNGAEPALRHLPSDAAVGEGDVVSTSGRGGMFPAALRVGVLRIAEGRPQVKPFAELTRLNYVSVLLFESPVRALADGTASSQPARRE